jgi:hypothetical protein
MIFLPHGDIRRWVRTAEWTGSLVRYLVVAAVMLSSS